MTRLVKLAFQRSDNEYQLELSWDDDAFSEGKLAFEVIVSHVIVGHPDSKRNTSASLSVERGSEGDEPMLVLKVADIEVQWKLRELFEESQIIDNIPSALFGLGDPITGCLVRSGLSTIVSQIIECKNATAGIDWFYPRTRAMAGCMKEHVPSMCGKTAFRAARCIAMAGAA